jgi:hypothetical protein
VIAVARTHTILSHQAGSAVLAARRPGRLKTAWLSGALTVFLTAGFVDVAVHVVHGSRTWETAAHVTTLVGMAAIVAALIFTGLQRQTRDKEL